MKLNIRKSKKKTEDLGIKVVTKEQAIWQKVKDAREHAIQTLEDELIIERAMLELAKNKLSEFE